MPKDYKNPETESFTPQEQIDLLSDLKHFGYLLPTDDEELVEFEQIYGTTQVIFPEHLKNSDFLLTKQKKIGQKKELAKRKPLKVKSSFIKERGKNDYFKKIVLAAEIANQLYMEPTFGHKKFVKILYLCEEVCDMQLSTNYKKFAAGPLDPKLMYSIDAEFKQQEWFRIVKRTGYGYKYEPLENVDRYKSYYLRNYAKDAEKIAELIELFRKKESAFCEIVATLYAVWKELLDNNMAAVDAALIKGFYTWDEAKAWFSIDQIKKGIKWMEEHGIVPLKST
jgi:hypothetical protein